MDEYYSVKQAVIATVYRLERPSSSMIAAFIREHRREFSLPDRDTTEKTVSYVLLILQRDQIVQRHVGKAGDFYVVDPIHLVDAEKTSARFNIHEVRIDDALKCLDASVDEDYHNDTVVAQSILFDPKPTVIPYDVPANAAAETACVIV